MLTYKSKSFRQGGVFRHNIIKSFKEGDLLRWITALLSRILPEMRNIVRKMNRIETEFRTDQDSYNWNKIKSVHEYLAKDSIDKKSPFTQLYNVLKVGDFETASKLHVEMYDKIDELKQLYDEYGKNMI